ncbi:hypothetical protein Lfu02_78140 [Longispora fulva]|uniref:Uncharacterized protein n=1 Tax=Longispora fulva TaxID=619741 RepID=A0A8J7GEP3_9ACTN|nr:hypothetical protein [Longispora fulva]MBG6136385.1 hypothetical protein [Longispora fulva]GIG63442.1 hypothetical protein Lfu02_78140 [Longispora fulva]
MDLRLRASTLAAVAAVGALFALPAPHPAAPPAQPAAAGPPVPLETAWPAAKVSTLPSVQPDGSTFLPLLVVSPDILAGMRNGKTFVLRTPTETRELAPNVTGLARTLDAYTVAGGQLFWIVSVKDLNGGQRSTLWTADIAAGPARVLATDTGAPRARAGALDLQVVDGVVHWAGDGPDGGTELRAVPATGGPVSTTRVKGRYTLSAWPWLSPAISTTGAPVELLNADTKAVLKVPAAKGRRLSCGPAWCRSSDDGVLELRRVDGSDPRRFGEQGARPTSYPIGAVNTLDVFTAGVASTASGLIRPLFLYDIPGHRVVQVASAAGAFGVRDNWLLWSTGDNEGLAWHFLDLRSLAP